MDDGVANGFPVGREAFAEQGAAIAPECSSASSPDASKQDASAWSVYLLSCADGSLYCGVTTDMPRRLAMHNGLIPGGAKYTRGRRPVTLAACAGGLTRSEALRLEARIKKTPRVRKIAELEACAAGGPLPTVESLAKRRKTSRRSRERNRAETPLPLPRKA